MQYKMRTLQALIILIFLSAFSLRSQTTGYDYLTGAKKGAVDTLSLKTAKENSVETKGIMEREIDPDKYIVGPGDEFLISIDLVKPYTEKLEISPDGRLFLPKAGIVDLRKKTLAESYKLIEEKLSETFDNVSASIIIYDIREFKVSVSGYVKKSQIVTATAMDRVSEVLDRANALRLESSKRHIKIIRSYLDTTLNADLEKYYINGNEESNPFVLGGDKIVVYPKNEYNPLVISGAVPVEESEFEFVKGDSLSTLIRFGHGFLPSANIKEVEFVRVDQKTQRVSKKVIDLSSWEEDLFKYDAKLEGDFPLEQGDRVFIRTLSDWVENNYIVIEGEVKYPGKYPIKEGEEKISELIARAGGFTEDAYPEAALYIRQEEQDEEDFELDRLRRLNPSDMSKSELRYFQVRDRERKGVMSFNLAQAVENPESEANIYVVHKDSLIVPYQKDYIIVQGRVNKPGAVLYNPDYTYLDYIQLAGGFGSRADEDETFITKSKGEQYLAEDMNYVLEPGDVILVPPKIEFNAWEIFMDYLTVVTQITAILAVVLTQTG